MAIPPYAQRIGSVKEALPYHGNPSQCPKARLGQGSFALTWQSLLMPQGSARSRKFFPNMEILLMPKDSTRSRKFFLNMTISPNASRLGTVKETFPNN